MQPLPVPEPAAFSVSRYLWSQLDAVEQEITPWLSGTDGTKGPISIPLAVRVALVQAYRSGMQDARADATNITEESQPWPTATPLRSSATSPASRS